MQKALCILQGYSRYSIGIQHLTWEEIENQQLIVLRKKNPWALNSCSPILILRINDTEKSIKIDWEHAQLMIKLLQSWFSDKMCSTNIYEWALLWRKFWWIMSFMCVRAVLSEVAQLHNSYRGFSVWMIWPTTRKMKGIQYYMSAAAKPLCSNWAVSRPKWLFIYAVLLLLRNSVPSLALWHQSVAVSWLHIWVCQTF